MTDTITTIRNADLESIAETLKALQARKADAVVSASRIRAEGGLLKIRGMGYERMVAGLDSDTEGTYEPSHEMVGQMGDKLGVPAQYLRKCQATRPDIFEANVNGWLHGSEMGPDLTGEARYPADDRKFLIRTYVDPTGGTGTGRAFLSDTYKPIEYLDLLTATLLGIKDSGKQVDFVTGDVSDTHFRARFACPEMAAFAPNLVKGYRSPVEPRYNPTGPRQVGDVFAGFKISDSEIGYGAATAEPEITMLACTNGMTINLLDGKQMGLRMVHLGSRLSEGPFNWSDGTRQKNAELVQAMARDAVTNFLDPEFLAAVVASIEARAGVELEHPSETIETVSQSLGFSEDVTRGVLDHFLRGGQATAGGVMNAVTSFAQTLSDANLAHEMEGLALEALELAARR